MESLGSYLKQGREEAGVTLEQLARRTRIRMQNLDSLEKEDLDSLPNDPYVRGFVKLVCRELGLSQQDGLVRYDTLRAHCAPPDEIIWSEDHKAVPTGRLHRAFEDPEQVVRRARRAARFGAWGGGLLIAGLLIWGVMRWFGGAGAGDEATQVAAATPAATPAAAEDDPAKTPAATEAVPAPPIELPLEQVALSTQRTPEIVPEEILVTVRPAGEASGDETSASDDVAPAQDAVMASAPESAAPKPAEDTSLAALVTGVTGEDATPGPPSSASPVSSDRTPVDVDASADLDPPAIVVPAAAGDRLVLEIEALRDVSVTVLLDGVGYPRTGNLAAGDRKTWKADRLFLLSADDGGAIRLRLSGIDLGVPGSDGVPLDRIPLRTSR